MTSNEPHVLIALVRQGHPAHRGREYITMSAAEYDDMTAAA